MKKYKHLILGIVIGVCLTSAAGVLANSNTHSPITAWLVNNVHFIFNGEYKSIPEEYGGVIIYNDRTYVPTRFIAESLGAEVNWDNETRTATIRSQLCPKCPDVIETNPEHNDQKPIEDDKKDQINDKEPIQPSGDYRKLPISKYFQDQEITVTSVIRTGDYNNIDADHKTHTRVYVRIENKGTNPIQLQQWKTKAIVDGKEYKTEGMPAYQLDEKWYHDLYEDDVVEGYITLPLIPKDAKEMKLTLYMVEGGWQQKEIEIEFDIALDLD